jgi:hypothetical protein
MVTIPLQRSLALRNEPDKRASLFIDEVQALC